MFLDKLELNNQEIEKKEEEFQALLLNVPEAEAVFNELRDFFTKTPFEDSQKKYRMTYWRWYTQLTWNRLNLLSQDDLVNIAFGEQAPMALFIDVDVWQALMWYFVANNYLENNVDSIYIKVKELFLASEAVVGEWKGEELTVAKLATEIKEISKQSNSLAQAEFESKLKQVMFPDDPMVDEYFIVDFDEAVKRFIDLVVSFQILTTENIWYVVDAFLNPEKYQNVVPGETALSAPAKPALASRPATPPPSALKKEEPKLVVPPTIRPKPSPAEIKSQIESQFKKDTEGNFADIEGVYKKLNELAEKYNDSAINDLIYFDESSGKFLWKLS